MNRKVVEHIRSLLSEVDALLEDEALSFESQTPYPLERLPEILKQQRQAFNLTQQQASDYGGISVSSVRRLESESDLKVNVETLNQLGDVLGFRLMIVLK